MGLTSRKKRPLNRDIPHFRNTSLIIIATEGAETEKQYFAFFRQKRVQVMVLPTPKDEEDPRYGHSSPRAVLKRLDEFKKQYDLGDQDQLWLMVDTDRWPIAQLDKVASDAQQKHFRMAVSNPCFELWLYLHHGDVDANRVYTCRELEEKLRALLNGFNKRNLRLSDFHGHEDVALARAEALDQSPEQRWPLQVGTHVYRVVRESKALGEAGGLP